MSASDYDELTQENSDEFEALTKNSSNFVGK